MIQTLYLAWRYLAFHRWKTAILVMVITLILYLPVGLRVLVNQSSEQLTESANRNPVESNQARTTTERKRRTMIT